MGVELLQTPTDEVTGMPYPILPYDVPNSAFTDYHHHFFPRRDEQLYPILRPAISNPEPEALSLEDIAKLATRMCRGQLLYREIHIAGHAKLSGPILPQTLDEHFTTVAKACSGVVPRRGIDVRRKGEDMFIDLKNEDLERFAKSRSICTERAYYDRPADYRRRIFGSFMLRYAVHKNLSTISSAVIDQFLDTKSEPRRLELGNLILMTTLERTVDPLVPDYTSFKKQGHVLEGRPGLRTVVKKMLRKDQWQLYHPALTTSLAAA